jgi:hypothetical protein
MVRMMAAQLLSSTYPNIPTAVSDPLGCSKQHSHRVRMAERYSRQTEAPAG